MNKYKLQLKNKNNESSHQIQEMPQTNISPALSTLLLNLNKFIVSHPLKALPQISHFESNKDDNSRNVYSGIISLGKFWYSERLCITLQEFQDMLISIGFFLSQAEKNLLIDDNVDLITLQNVLEGVQEWKYEEKDVTTFLSKKQDRKFSHKISTDPETNLLVGTSFVYQQNFASSSHGLKNPNLTKSYLKEHSRRQNSNKIRLANTLKQVKNQSDYQITVKVGQVNDICRRLKNGYSYILNTGTAQIGLNNADLSSSKISMKANKGSSLRIIECQKSGEEVVIALKIFERKYEAYKQSMINAVQDFQGSMEQDLRKVLVEVMCLSSQIKSQISLLQSKGISS